MDNFNSENEIVELNNDVETLEDIIKKEVEGNSKKRKKKFKLSKKQIILLISSIILVLLVIGVILFFTLKKDNKKVEEEPSVIIEKDNYRYENGKLVFLNASEKDIGIYECVNKDSEKCFVTKINHENDLFDRVKNINENRVELIKTSKIYHDKYVFVTDGNKTYLYNMIDDEKELELKSIKTYNTNEDYVVIENEKNLFGLIEITDDGYNELIRCSYDNLGIVNTTDILLVAKDKDKSFVINKEGKKLSKNISAEVKAVSKDYIIGEINNTYNVFSYDYEELISGYDFISVHDRIIALVKDNSLYLLDENLNKMYEEGIKLENSEYVKKYVYDSDNRLKETLKSYEIEVKNNNIKVTIGDNTKEINSLEGLISSKFSFVNYFNGKLYIYSDEEKTELLSSYKCNNLNKISSGEDGLTNCGIYASELGVSGIYNNQYVFVYDNDGSNTLYYLYDLKNNKIKGTYDDIEFLTNDDLSENIKHIDTESSFIKAKSATGNNKGNYGVIEITREKVQGKIGFNYESITRENDYYKLINTDKTYSIYDKDLKKVSNEFSYIKTYEKYYVGINNNKLNVFTYNDQLEILKESVPVTNNEFEIDFNNGFEITVKNVKYNYDKDGNVVKNNANDKLQEEGDNSNGEE